MIAKLEHVLGLQYLLMGYALTNLRSFRQCHEHIYMVAATTASLM